MACRVFLVIGTAVVGVGASASDFLPSNRSLLTTRREDDDMGRQLKKYHLNKEFAPGPARPIYPDTWDPFCNVGQKCSAGEIPEERGLCVLVGDSKACWDACNTKHAPEDYRVGENPVNNSAFEEMVRMVREGDLPYARCPGDVLEKMRQADSTLCEAGKRCSSGDIPENRGMCVPVSNGNEEVCKDMCDKALDAQEYVIGTASQTKATVLAVRDGSDPLANCASGWLANWPWIIVALLVIAVLVCVGWVCIQRSQRRIKGRALQHSDDDHHHSDDDHHYYPEYPPPEPNYPPMDRDMAPMMPEPAFEPPPPQQEPLPQQQPLEYSAPQNAFTTINYQPLQTTSMPMPQYQTTPSMNLQMQTTPSMNLQTRQYTNPQVSPFQTQPSVAYGGYAQARPY